MIGGKMSTEKLVKALNDAAGQGWQLKAITAVEGKGRSAPEAWRRAGDRDTHDRVGHDRVRHDRVDQSASSTCGTPASSTTSASAETHARTHVIILIQDLNIRVIAATTGEIPCDLTLDPA